MVGSMRVYIFVMSLKSDVEWGLKPDVEWSLKPDVE